MPFTPRQLIWRNLQLKNPQINLPCEMVIFFIESQVRRNPAWEEGLMKPCEPKYHTRKGTSKNYLPSSDISDVEIVSWETWGRSSVMLLPRLSVEPYLLITGFSSKLSMSRKVVFSSHVL